MTPDKNPDHVPTPMLVSKDGLVSFDGVHGPWMRLISADEVRELGAKALRQTTGATNDPE